MPVIIQEIVITATVDASTSSTGGSAGAGAANGPPTDTDARQALVQECVEEVMRILREKAER